MKKVLLVSAFYLENSTSRPYQIRQFFDSIGFSTKVLTTNFNHSTKEKFAISSPMVKQIKVVPYKSTFSLARILSHVIFALKVALYLKKEEYDLLYVAIPPNLSAFISVSIAKKQKKTIISDLIDLWPQSTNSLLFKLPLYLWRNLSILALNNSDVKLIESKAYIPHITPAVKDYRLLYLAKFHNEIIPQEIPHKRYLQLHSNLRIAYVGNFSDSYDFDSLILLLNELVEFSPSLVLIGDGYLKQKIKDNAHLKNIKVEDYGIVFDEKIKNDILSICHFAYNGVKSSSIVGLSYKSIDYLSFGLPILNSVGFDTSDIIEEYKCGINFAENKIEYMSRVIRELDETQYFGMCKNASLVFYTFFSEDAFKKTISKHLYDGGILDGENYSV